MKIVCHLCNTLTLFTPGSPWMPEEIKTHVVAHFVGNFRSKNAYKLYINTKKLHLSLFTAICFYFPGLLLSFVSPVALIFKPIANLLLYGWIVSTTGQLTCNIKGPSNIIWFYQLSWQCKLATVKRFESWRFER